MTIQSSISQLKPLFRFPFHDRQSRTRFLIGSALSLAGFIVPIIPGLFVYGYTLRVLRLTAEGESPSMLPWDDWSTFLSLGFRGAIISLLFTAPAIVVFLVGISVYFGTFFLLPFSSGPEANGAESAFAILVLVAMAVMFLSMALGSILLVLGTIPLPASTSHFVVKDQMSAAFRVREWWPILSANRLGYFISFVIVSGILGIAYYAFFALYSTLVLLCVAYLIMVPVLFYAMLVAASVFGVTYREGRAMVQEHSLSSSPE
jgi:hypothetical protein